MLTRDQVNHIRYKYSQDTKLSIHMQDLKFVNGTYT